MTTEAEELTEILNHLPRLVVCTFDEDLVYKRAFGTLFPELGITPEEIIGQRVEDVVEPHRRPLVLPYFSLVLAGGDVTFLHERNNIFLEISLYPIRRVVGKFSMVVGGISVSRDVSHRIRNIMMADSLGT